MAIEKPTPLICLLFWLWNSDFLHVSNHSAKLSAVICAL